MDPPYETFQRREVSRRWAKIRVAGTSGRIAPPGFIDANTVMTKPTDVRFGWLMVFWTDWFVCDGIHDRQNVSLHQSIKTRHARWHIFITRRKGILCLIYSVGWGLLETVVPTSKILSEVVPGATASAGNRKAEAITRNESGATRTQQQTRTR